MKEETELIHSFINEFSSSVNQYHATRIESNLTVQGIPDLNVLAYGYREFWVEFKIGRNELSPLQLSWIANHRMNGGFVFVLRLKEGMYYLSYSDVRVQVCDTLWDVIIFILGMVK